MINDFTHGTAARGKTDLNLHSGRVQEAYSSKHLCIRPRVPMGINPADLAPPTANDRAKAAENDLRGNIIRMEKQLIDALFARTTAHVGEHRILKSAFTKFDTDMSGAISCKEFKKALECLGLHSSESGLPGFGGYPEAVVEGLFASYDKDGSGEIDYNESVEQLLKDKDSGPL